MKLVNQPAEQPSKDHRGISIELSEMEALMLFSALHLSGCKYQSVQELLALMKENGFSEDDVPFRQSSKA